MKAIIVIICVVILNLNTNAQITKVDLQASGLTCSMCNKSIHKSLSTIPGIKSITPDLTTNTFSIVYNDSSTANFDELKEKVEKAGYKVASLTAIIPITEQTIQNDSHIKVDSLNFHFINVKTQTIKNEIAVKIIDKGFIPAKEFKVFSKKTTMSCYQTGYMQSCCTSGGKQGDRIIHVTI